jgi:glycosyltransferase involved in cell wall biosynthesis
MSTDEKALLGKISPASKYLTYGSYILTLFHEHFSNFKDFSKVENTLRVSHDYYSSYTSHIAKFSKSEVELLATLPPLSYFKTNNHLEELMTIKQLPIAHDSKQNILHFLEYLGFQQENPQTPAPPIRSEKKVDFGVNIMGYPQSEMGLGEDARTTLRALQKNAIPVSALSIESKDHHHPKLISEINEFISDTQKYKINIINSPIATAAFEIYRNKSLSQFQEFYNIAYAPWELETWPHELQSCLKIYNEIWAPSRFIEKAFQNNFNIPVHYMPLAVTINPFEKRSRDYFGLPNDKYIYLSMFDFNSSLNRKNPYDSVRAFKMAFTKNEDVILAIKVMYSKESVEWNNFIQLIDNDPRIIIINKVLSRQDVLALFDVCDSFISLHRSEGFGRCLAEAMLLKKPVIATDYSGNVDFCTIEFSFPVDYQLIKVQPTEYVFVDGQNWAAPILESAVQQMREVFYNRKLTLQVTNNAYKNISENFSELACGKRYAQRVLEIKKDLCEYL